MALSLAQLQLPRESNDSDDWVSKLESAPEQTGESAMCHSIAPSESVTALMSQCLSRLCYIAQLTNTRIPRL